MYVHIYTFQNKFTKNLIIHEIGDCYFKFKYLK